jgi:hypothetical protein
MRRIVIAATVGVIAAVALRLGTRGPRYAYGQWSDPTNVMPRVVPIIDGP